MKKLLFIALLMPLSLLAQKDSTDSISVSVGEGRTGFIYSPGISWTENKKQDSVVKIFIEGDTMAAIRNLLVYCLQQKSENDNASIILSMINLDILKSLFKSNEFNFYVKEYRKSVLKHKKSRTNY